MIAFHVVTASVALVLGALIFLLPKGTALHRRTVAFFRAAFESR